MSVSGVIFDGMERKGYVPERAYVCSEIRYWYRPLGITAKAIYMDGMATAVGHQAQDTLAVGMIAQQLIRWDLQYPADWPDEELRNKPVPCKSPERLLKILDPHVHKMISATIAGLIASPIDPTDSVADQQAAAKLRAGRTPEDVLKAMSDAEAERLGNSSAAQDS